IILNVIIVASRLLDRRVFDLVDVAEVATIFFAMALLFLLFKLMIEARNEAIKSTQQFYIDDINRMFTTVRGQRHDFMNHVQIISSMLRMNRVDDAKQYTGELVGETSEINEIMSIGNPALAALVQAKSSVALTHKVRFEYNISGVGSVIFGPKSIDLIKVLGNLLNNAFDESMKLPIDQRVVELAGRVEDEQLIFSVWNRGTYIDEGIRAQLFQPGFSTKAGQHQGLGLSIVKERLDFYRGSIEVNSSIEDGTKFVVSIPCKKIN
ncbi:sensor histidine kinase, partial [Paenibacillus koleovorans]|uniref:sensor histidine kinase n=1 Tax=Paenibacillus koleovorans TaxID=121608 RepID=UPI000FD79E9E